MKNILKHLSWLFNVFTFLYAVDYRVTVRTGQGLGTGTDSDFNITLIGWDGSHVTFLMSGDGGRLETRRQDVFEFTDNKLVYPLDKLSLKRVEKRGWNANWFVNWILVEVEDSMYVFRINRWIRNDETKYYTGTLGECKEGFKRIQQCVK